MKARFDIHFPLNGRYTPVQGITPTPPRTYTRRDRQSPSMPSAPATTDSFSQANSQHPYKLEEEIKLSELEDYTNLLISQLTNTQENSELYLEDLLPSYVKLQRKYEKSRKTSKDQQSLARKLVQVAEPLLSNGAVTEKEKQGLLNVTGLAVEKVMQLKMRSSNLRQRIIFLKLTIPQYVENYARLLGHPSDVCQQLANVAKSEL